MGWTDERVELLKKLWQDGLSASQIAKQLGGVTRNAVIGKVHRQWKGVSKVANDSFEFGPAPSYCRGTYDNDVLAAIAMKQSIESCQERHV
jgi:hypothetical protein